MIITIKIIKNMLYVVAFIALLFSFVAKAEEINDFDKEYNSIYRYNSLENKVSFPDLAITNNDLAITNNTETIIAVKELHPADKLPDDISQKLQDITLKQDFSIKQIENAIYILKNRSGLKTFLIGNSVGVLRFQLVQIGDQISALNILATKTEDSAIKNKIDNQVKFLKEEKIKVEDIILEQEKEFSLFGWLVTIL